MASTPDRQTPRLFSPGSWTEASRIAAILRLETVGGLLLLVSAVVALVWANLPGDTYFTVREYHLGPASLGLDLSVHHWAADGLLAIFFFLAGLEVKREFVAGDLRRPRTAAVPIAAAVGGMIVPALIYVGVNLMQADRPAGALAGWAVPSATDIAFALGVLAVIGQHLPSALRLFLLTVAVVDDLLAILVIAVFYSNDISLGYLAAAMLPLAAFTVLVQRRIRSPWLLMPLALLTWVLVHHSGLHATLAGIFLGLAVPVLGRADASDPDSGAGLADHFEHRWRPISAGFAVPVFAIFSAGVYIGGRSELASALSDPIALGVIAGLVVGKPIGIFLTTWGVARFTRAELDERLRWLDVFGVGVLGGMGFTVSLLIGSLAFGEGTTANEHVTLGVLVGSAAAAVLGALILGLRSRAYRLMYEQEGLDEDGDGIPDMYQQEQQS